MTPDRLAAWRDALLEARFRGVLTVKAGDKSVTYRSDAELAAAIAAVEVELAQTSGRRRPRFLATTAAKGL